MKKSLVLLLLFAILSTHAQEKIDFIDNDWQKAADEAKKSGKYIFVDAYTDWCYWCKVMVKETFSKDEVADAINKNFVPLKMEMEKGFGRKLNMKYLVSGYPTYLVFNPDGKLIYKFSGYMPAKVFLEKLAEASDPAKQFTATGISNKIEMDFPDFYQKSFTENGNHTYPDAATVKNYLDKQTDLLSEVNFDVMMRFTGQLSDKYLDYLLTNRDKYAKLYSQEAMNQAIYGLAGQKIDAAIKDSSEAKLKETYAFIDAYFPDQQMKDINRAYYGTRFYESRRDWKKFAQAVEEYTHTVKPNDGTSSSVNGYSWTIYEKCTDLSVIEKALGWMKPVIEAEPKYEYLDTYAALLYKAKKYKAAETYANKAIELGKKEGQKTEATEKLLEKIKKEKQP